MARVIIVGSAYPYRGGIAAFNERLCHEFISMGHDVEIVTFTLQYPSFLFPGKTQYSEDAAPSDLRITRIINSVNPFSWIRATKFIGDRKPDHVVFAYWLPYMAPCLGYIARHCKSRTVGLVHNFLPHEHKPGDKMFSRYFASSVESFVTLSKSVAADIRAFAGSKTVSCTPHPLYDNFGASVDRNMACERLGLDPSRKVFLFFGLIRDYKGLDLLIESFASLSKELRDSIQLVVAGEFYSSGEKYHHLAASMGVDSEIVWKTCFVPDSEVRIYFSAADLIVQPYKSATQSGVTQIAYHFEKPMLVTDVGGLSEIVPDGKVGYVVEPDAEKISFAFKHFLSDSPDFSEGIREEKKKYSWDVLAWKILK